jgi:hypothetical protein
VLVQLAILPFIQVCNAGDVKNEEKVEVGSEKYNKVVDVKPRCEMMKVCSTAR